MITTVTGKNQVTVPARIASQHAITAGSRLDWEPTDQPDVLRVKVLPNRIALAASVSGAGHNYLKTGDDPIADLITEREREETERERDLR